MKSIEVVAGIIIRNNKILATRRGYGEFINMWEFPGGKIEKGETKKEALIREIKEELDVEINPYEFLITVEYTYPNFHLIMHCFLSEITNGEIKLLEHNDCKWLNIDELDNLNWLPADIDVLNELKAKFK